jgi:uncharacterized membrane protein (GlpM family)
MEAKLVIKFAVTLLLLVVLFFFMSRQQYLISSLVASFPSFTFLTYYAAREPKITALYLGLFTLAISITMFILYFSKFSQAVNTIIGICLWFAFSMGILMFFSKGFKSF